MAGKKEKLDANELAQRDEAELGSLLAGKGEDLRKARFTHAVGQLRETHKLKELRRDIARLNTALSRRRLQAKEAT